MTRIQPGTVVTLHFTLTDADGTVLDDSAARGQPLQALFGVGTLQRGVEAALEGHVQGDAVRAVVPPEQGFGVRRGEPMPVPRAALPDSDELVEGQALIVRTPDGRPMMLWVVALQGDDVLLDPNHPLAGRTLTWDMSVLHVRDANPEELRQGRPLDA